MHKTIEVLGKQISYLDQGPSDLGVILFIHGNSFSSQSFYPQFNSSELSSYRLIAIDLYGHGESESLDGVLDYSIPKYAELVSAFIKKLDLKNIVLAGHSLGGHIALELIAKESLLVSGVFTWGAPPVTNPILATNIFHPNPAAAYLYQENISEVEIELFLKNCLGKNTVQIDSFKEMVKKTNPHCRSSLANSIGVANYSDEVIVVENAPFNVAVAYASLDAFMNPEYFENLNLKQLWQGSTLKIEGSHFCHIDNSIEFNSRLKEYIDSSFGLFLSNHRKNIVEENILGSI